MILVTEHDTFEVARTVTQPDLQLVVDVAELQYAEAAAVADELYDAAPTPEEAHDRHLAFMQGWRREVLAH